MGSCRLCSGDTSPNNRLDERSFREKVLDVMCMWIDISDQNVARDVCDPCYEMVEKFFLFKRNCRLFQSKIKEDPKEDEPFEHNEPLQEMVADENLQLVVETLDIRMENGGTSTDEGKSEGEFFQNCPPIKDRKKNTTQKSSNRERIIIARPYRRKFQEAADLPSDEYRRYAVKKKTIKRQTSVCDICGRTIDSCRIDGHRNRHLGLQPYECEQCGDKFNCKLNLRSHQRRNHVEGQECPCTVCGKMLSSRPTLQSHMKSVHGEKRFACSLCPLKFNSNATLIYHMKIHNQTRDFVCSLCGKGFYCKSVWNIHMRTHSGETPYRCSVCEESFVHRNMYVAHMKRKHPGVPLMYLSGKKGFMESMTKKGIGA